MYWIGVSGTIGACCGMLGVDRCGGCAFKSQEGPTLKPLETSELLPTKTKNGIRTCATRGYHILCQEPMDQRGLA